MSHWSETIPWDLLARYAAGDCAPHEVADLSRRIESEPGLAEGLAEVLLQGVVVCDDAQTHPASVCTAQEAIAKRSGRGAPAIWAMAAAVVMLISLVWLVYFHSDARRDILTVAQADGSVRWTGAGGEVREALARGASLPGGSLETVSDDGTLTVAFSDGTMLTLLGRTVATISDDAQKTVHLRSGSLSADVRPQPSKRPLIIHTPTARLEVLGTRFEVDSDAANTRLAVNEGRVRLTRLVDGRVAEVSARQEAVVSLSGDELPVAPRQLPEVLWRSDFGSGPAGTQGRWLPADGGKAVRLAAEPVFLPKSSRGAVTIHRVGLTPPWQKRANIQVRPDSRVRLRGHTAHSATLEVMLGCMRTTGGSAGNWFQQHRIGAGEWQIDLPVNAFRKWHAQAKDTPVEALELRGIAIYTINEDAGLEVESVEVLSE